MISIDWQQVIGYVLVIGGGIAGLAGGVYGLREAWRIRKPLASERSADAPAPAGAVEWAVDICAAMGTASAESKLTAITNGYTRDAARKFRIAELEGKP